jgi:Na+-driven multidrug efflux pump
MSINGALFNIIAAATAPLGTGTTAVISRVRGLQEQKANGLNVKKPLSRDMNKNMNQNENEKKEFSVGEIFLSGIFLAAAGGTVLSSLCHLLGEGFVAQVFQIKGSLLDVTAEYLKIRSLSLPSVLLNYIVFGFSIAMQDSIAPVLSIVTAFIFNVLGDYVLVGRMGYSLTGAAIATALSSYLGSFVALRHIFKTNKIRLPRTARTEEGNKDDKIDAVNSSNKRWGRRRGGGGIMWRRIFNKQGMEMFFTASGPLLAGAMVNTMTYSAGARIASFTQDPMLSTVQVAAHQIVMQSWWFLSYFSSPFSLVAQAVIPKDLIKGNTKRVKRMAALLLKLTAAAGVIVTAINVLLILQFPGTFTKNLEIQSIARNVLLPSSVSLFIICMSTVSDGIFIGCNAVQDYLAASVLSTTAAWLYYAFSINQKLGLTGAWNGLLIFSVVRMGYYCTKYGKLWASVDKHNNTNNSSSNSSSSSSKQ